MKARLKFRVTYANVVASIALFAALGGSSYAAITLPAKSVGPKQIRQGAVRSGKVKDGSLLAKDFKSGQLPGGPKGDAGPRGPQGERGVPGEPGQPGTARAYALVNEDGAQNGVDPAFVPAYVKGFTSVRRLAKGSYCVQVGAGIDPATTPAIVSPEFGHSGGANLNAYWQDSDACHPDEYQVATDQGGAFSDDVAFTILVP